MVTFPTAPLARVASVAPLSAYPSVHEAVQARPWQRQVRDWVTGGPGVLGYSLTLKSTVCALGNWYMAEPDSSGGWKRVEDPREQAVLHSFTGMRGEFREEMFRQQVFTLDALGEFLLGVHNTGLGPRYEIIQLNQIVTDAGGVNEMVALQDSPMSQRQRRDDKNRNLRYLPKDQVVRVWTRHPWWPELAHSPMERAVPDIERLESSTRRLRRLSDSRLVNNDIVWLAAEAAGQYAASGDGRRKADFHRDFREFARRQYSARGGVEEVAPFTLSTGSAWGPPQKIDMASPISDGDLAAEEAAYRAIGRALDLPMRIFFESEQGGNHWSDWLVESQFIRTSAEPAAQRAADMLTIAWMRPMIEHLNEVGWLKGVDPERRRIKVDMSGVLKNPDESKTLLNAWTMGIAARETVAKRGLNLTDDEILELPEGWDDFEAWQELNRRGRTGGAGGADPLAGSGNLPARAAALQAARDGGVPPQLLAMALEMLAQRDRPEPDPTPEVVEAERIVRGEEYLDHAAYAADSDLLELLA